MSGISVRFTARWLSFVGLVLFLLGVGAQALMPPNVLLQRSRASHALDASQRDRARAVAQDAPITVSPEEYTQRLQAAQPDLARALAFQYYSAVAHLERREEIVEAYGLRRSQVEAAIQALDDYIDRCHLRLRAFEATESYSVTKWPVADEPAQPPFQFRVSTENLRVYRTLPWPEHLELGLVWRALELGEEERRRCEHDRDHIDNARREYLKGHVVWLRWLNDLAGKIEIRSEASLRKEIDRP